MEIGDYYFIKNITELNICKITKKEISNDGLIFFIKDSFTLRKHKGISLTYTKEIRTSIDFNNCSWMTRLEKEEGEKRWKEFEDIYERILKNFNINDNVS